MTTSISENLKKIQFFQKATPKFLSDEGLFKTKEKQRFAITFYGGFAKASYKKIGESYGTSKDVARNHINQWLNLGLIKKVNNLYKPDLYLPSKGRNCLVQGENYYRITKKGRVYRKGILNGAIQRCKEINRQSEIKFLNETNKVKELIENNLNNFLTSILSYLLNKFNKRREPGRGASSSSLLAFDRKNLRIGGISQKSCSSLDQIFKSCVIKTKSKSLKKRKVSETNHIAKEGFKNTDKWAAIQKTFITFGFKKFLNKAYIGTQLKLMTLSMQFVEKLLQLMKNKLKHKWKLRHFWGFFLSEVKRLPESRRFAQPWFRMRAQECRDASDGKHNKFSQGVDTSVIIQGITKMERETGEKASESTLERMLYHGTEKLKTAIDMIAYRMTLGKGELPQEQADEEDNKKPKKRPIFKMIKVNAQTKQPYTDADREAGKPFAMLNKIVGYESINGQAQEQKAKEKVETIKSQSKKEFTKINSWIGMVFFALKIGNPSAIYKAFFEKREQAA